VDRDFIDGTLPGEFDKSDREEIKARLQDAELSAQDEVWAGYRYIALYDAKSEVGITVIDLGAGHANAIQIACPRRFVEQCSRLERRDHPTRESFSVTYAS
jgi:hypothetical protein